MLEVKSHQQVKSLLKQFPSSCQNNLTLSRIVGRSLRRKDQTVIEFNCNEQYSYWLGILIPLYIEKSKRVLVLSQEQKNHIIGIEIPKLQKIGIDINFWDKDYPSMGDEIWLMDYKLLLESHKKNYLEMAQIVLAGSEDINFYLREAMSLEITPLDWIRLINDNPNEKEKLLDFYNKISRRLFSQVASKGGNVRMDCSTIYEIKALLKTSNNLESSWRALSLIESNESAIWAELNHKSLTWIWHIQPLEPINKLEQIIQSNPFILMIENYTKNNFLKPKVKLNLAHNNVKLKRKYKENKILLFAPKYQPLPNSEIYEKHILEQSKRLIIGINGLTILLIDEESLLIRVTSQLAGEFGKRVTYEKTINDINGIICCSSSWWINNQKRFRSPDQLIVGLLPIASLASPLTAARVEALKRKGRDWFRELLLPEAVNTIAKSIIPLRNNDGRLAILDGRLRSRSWGNEFLKNLQPLKELNRLLPN